MSKKTDRIDELESRCAVQISLLRNIGELLGIEVGDDINATNAPRYSARFSKAILAGKQRKNDGDGDDESLGGQRYNTFDDLVDSEIDRLQEKGLTVRPGASAGTAIATTSPSSDDVRATIDNIATEIGIDVRDMTGADAMQAIHREMMRLKNPSADIAPDAAGPLSKGDTLVEAFAHITGENRHIADELANARLLIGRIASAMHIDRASGDEILERVQRWETIRYTLKKRAPQVSEETARELQAIFVQIVAPRDFASWFAKNPTAVSSTVMKAAEAGVQEPVAELHDASYIYKALEASEYKGTKVHALFQRIASNAAASVEFARFLNTVISALLPRPAPTPSSN